jgi:iron complex transport system substrate-binding protein
VTWEQALAVEPDIVVCAPCGYDLPGSVALARELVTSGVLPEHIPVWAVDANASFARPGPRLVDGVETLVQMFAQTFAQPFAQTAQVRDQPARTIEGAAQQVR